MDIALCIFDPAARKIQYSGANNPLYLIRDKDLPPVDCEKQISCEDIVLYELKADPMPIAIHLEMRSYRAKEFEVFDKDCIYLFSDGFADQFGGRAENGRGKKFMSKGLKNALLCISHLDMDHQKEAMEQTLNSWMGHVNPDTGQPYEQLDDICLLGIKMHV